MMRAQNPIALKVYRRGNTHGARVVDAGAGFKSDTTNSGLGTLQHTYTVELIIPKSKSYGRREFQAGVRTEQERSFRMAAVDNPGVTLDVLLEDTVQTPDGLNWTVKEVKAYPPGATAPFCWQIDCYGKQ